MVSSSTSGAMYLSNRQHNMQQFRKPWMTKRSRSLPPPDVSDDANLLVPTLWLGAMSMVSEAESWRTANPRSAMAQLQFFFTRMFLDFRSLWAMPGFPGEKTLARSESKLMSPSKSLARSLSLSQKNWFEEASYAIFHYRTTGHQCGWKKIEKKSWPEELQTARHPVFH